MSRYLLEDLDDPALREAYDTSPAAHGYDLPMPDNPELLPLGKGILAYTVRVRGVNRVAQFAVVFRGEASDESRGLALGRLQWFVLSFIGPCELRDMSTDSSVEASLPIDTLFLTSELEGESFWCGPSPVDQTLVRRALGLPGVLSWGWERDDQIGVNEMKTSKGDA